MSVEDELQTKLLHDFERVALFTLLLEREKSTPGYVDNMLEVWEQRQRQMLQSEIDQDLDPLMTEQHIESMLTVYQNNVEEVKNIVKQIVKESGL